MMIFLLLLFTAQAATLDQIRLFKGKGHCRILLTVVGEIASIQSEALPSSGKTPARGIVLLTGVSLKEEKEIPVYDAGLQVMKI